MKNEQPNPNRANRRARSLIYALCAGLFLGAVACGGEADPSNPGGQAPVDVALARAGSTAGGACTVTDGPHKGMTGTYDEDGWCCSGNVCVECTPGASGTSRCKDGASTTLPVSRIPIVISAPAQLLSK